MIGSTQNMKDHSRREGAIVTFSEFIDVVLLFNFDNEEYVRVRHELIILHVSSRRAQNHAIRSLASHSLHRLASSTPSIQA